MDMKGEFRIPLPQAVVWRALNDADILKASVPGCDELIRESESSFKGRISAAVGPVRAKFAGQASLSDIDAPNGYTLTGNGSGGAAGMVKGGATVRLVPDGDATLLYYEAHAQVAGKLAQIGARLVDMAAKKMADEFFSNFVQQLEKQPLTPASAAVPMPDATPEATVMPEPLVSIAPMPPASVRVEPPATEPTPVESNSPKRPPWLIWVLIALAALVAAALLKGLL